MTRGVLRPGSTGTSDGMPENEKFFFLGGGVNRGEKTAGTSFSRGDISAAHDPDLDAPLAGCPYPPSSGSKTPGMELCKLNSLCRL